MTYYWISGLLVLAGLLLLVVVVSRLQRALRGFRRISGAAQAVLRSELGLLRARRAALAVAARSRAEQRGAH